MRITTIKADAVILISKPYILDRENDCKFFLFSPKVLSTDDCWSINIKAPASLTVETKDSDEDGFQVVLVEISWIFISAREVASAL